jgi:hypothetical protein
VHQRRRLALSESSAQERRYVEPKKQRDYIDMAFNRPVRQRPFVSALARPREEAAFFFHIA